MVLLNSMTFHDQGAPFSYVTLRISYESPMEEKQKFSNTATSYRIWLLSYIQKYKLSPLNLHRDSKQLKHNYIYIIQQYSNNCQYYSFRFNPLYVVTGLSDHVLFITDYSQHHWTALFLCDWLLYHGHEYKSPLMVRKVLGPKIPQYEQFSHQNVTFKYKHNTYTNDNSIRIGSLVKVFFFMPYLCTSSSESLRLTISWTKCLFVRRAVRTDAVSIHTAHVDLFV